MVRQTIISKTERKGERGDKEGDRYFETGRETKRKQRETTWQRQRGRVKARQIKKQKNREGDIFKG